MIVHIMCLDKFIPPYIDFLSDHFEISNHLFIIYGKPRYEFGLRKDHNVKWIDKRSKYFMLLIAMYRARKIILHGLWIERINQLLFLQPWLLKKCYWVMWGGDFYFPEKQGWIKKQIIKRVGNLVTYIEGDVQLAQKWYGSKGKYRECFMYPSNLFKKFDIITTQHSKINIQVGNSASRTNNHFEVFKKLEKYKNQDIEIFAPLSYGDEEYAQEVILKGKEIFGNKFVPIIKFMHLHDYLKFLSKIDIAIFANNRQEAMGNTITLLGLGKKVYMRSDVTQWQLFKDIGVRVYNFEELDLNPIDEETKRKNQEIIRSYFSEVKLKEQLTKIFKEDKE